jgi:photosystem II stability/assembly factor-like uncharacterized protein
MRVIYSVFLLLISMSMQIIAQWFWQNPLPQGNGLNKVEFISPSIGWAVGEAGTIIKTTNGGISWIPQTSGVQNDLLDVSFSDENYGAAVGQGYQGSSNIILRTTNGGNSWFEQSNPATGGLNGVHFIDKNTGTAVSTYASIIRTTDGGETWTNQQGITNYPYIDVFFTNVNNGIIVGEFDLILKTTNGGATWTRIQTGITNWSSATFSDSDNGWIVGENGKIARTTDGGATWTEQTSGTTNDLSDVFFIDSNLGIAVGYSAQYATVVRTTDGGSNWTPLYIEQDVKEIGPLQSVIFSDSENAIAVGDNGIIINTTDGGINWDKKSSNVTSTDLTDVFFVDENNGYASGGTMLKTTDGGLTWNDIGGGGSSVSFIDVNNGIVVGDGKIYKTTNAGSDWSETFSDYELYLRDVEFIDMNNAIVVGDSGKILKSTDGGNTWNEQSSGTTNNLSSVAFANLNSGLAVSWFDENNGSLILKTTDGGINWSSYIAGSDPNGGIYDLLDVSFPDLTNGFVVGDIYSSDGHETHLLKTTDGGSTWFEQIVETEIDDGFTLRGVSFVNGLNGTVIGDNLIVKTTDGGGTWSNQSIPLGWENSLNAIHMIDENSGTIVGYRGTILRTTNGGVAFLDEGKDQSMPAEYKLFQNYPNPFNPNTNISWQAQAGGWQTLKIYDILGKEIAKLVDEFRPAGNYEVKFDASNLSSGVYFYKLQSGNFIQTKKMILIK